MKAFSWTKKPVKKATFFSVAQPQQQVTQAAHEAVHVHVQQQQQQQQQQNNLTNQQQQSQYEPALTRCSTWGCSGRVNWGKVRRNGER